MHQTPQDIGANGSCGTPVSDLAPCRVAYVDLQGCTALHYAAHRGTNATVGTLLSAGTDANIASFTVCDPASAYKVPQLCQSVSCASGHMAPQGQHALAPTTMHFAWHSLSGFAGFRHV